MNKFIMILAVFCVALNAEALRAVCDRDNVKDMVACEEKGLGRLMWQDGADIFEGDWDEAKRYCENLNFAGYLDWRLPTSLELLSITDDSRFDPAINRAFKNFVSRSYWSSIKSAGFSSISGTAALTVTLFLFAASCGASGTIDF